MNTYTFRYLKESGDIGRLAAVQCAADIEAIQRAHDTMLDRYVSLQIFDSDRLVFACAHNPTCVAIEVQSASESTWSRIAEHVRWCRDERDLLTEKLAALGAGTVTITAGKNSDRVPADQLTQITQLKRVIMQLDHVIAACSKSPDGEADAARSRP